MILGFGQNRAFDIQRWVESTSLEDCKWILRAYWKRILFCTFIGLGLAVVYNRWSPEVYISQATVRFIPPQVSQRYVTSNVAMQVEQRIFAVTQLVNSRLTAAKLIETFNLYPQRRRFIPIADLVPVFQRDLVLRTTVNHEGDSKSVPSIVIGFRYSDADRAQKVVQRIVELIYEENRRYRSDQSIGTTDFLQGEVKTAVEQMTAIEERLAKLPTPGGEDKEYRNIVRTGHLHDLERRLTDLKHQINYVTMDRDQRKSIVEGLEYQLRRRQDQEQARVAPVSWAADRLRNQVEMLEARADDLRTRYKPDHVDLVATQKALVKAKEELVKQEELDRTLELQRDVEAISAQLAKARSELAGYEQTLLKHSQEDAQLTREVAELRAQFSPNEDRANERLNAMREYESAKSHYLELTKRQRESELASDMERRGHGETVELVEPPTFPLQAEWPTRPMVFGLGMLAGFGVGYLLGIISFLRKPHVRIAQHLEILGPYPVLACLPGTRPFRKAPVRRGVVGLASMTISLALLVSCSNSGEAFRRAQLKLGEEAAAKGDHRAAMIHYRKAIQDDARFGDAYFRMGESLLAIGQVIRAKEQFERAAELLPTRFDVQERLGDLTYQVYFADPGRPVAIIREVEEVAGRLIERWPGKASGYRLKAQALIERHRMAEAIDLMERMLEKIEDGPVRTQLAAAYFHDGRAADAERHLRKCIEGNPKFSPGFDLLYLQLMDKGRVAEAREVLMDKVKRHGGIDAGLQLAAHDDALNGRTLAEERLTSLVKQFQNDPESYAKVGDFWLHRGEHEKARYWYESGQAVHPASRSLFTGRLADLLMAKRDAAGAKKLIAEALAANPQDPLMKAYEAAFELDGQSATDRKQAQAKLESVLVHMPNSPFVRLHLGRAYLLSGDVLRAAEHLQNCVTLDPNYAPGWLALAEFDLASGNTSTAEERLTTLLRRAPGYTPARLLQAQASLAQRRPEEAEKALKALLAAEPDNTEAMLILARASAGTGKVQEAHKLLERVRELRPQDIRPTMLEAKLDVESGKPRAALERLKDAYPRHKDVPELEATLASVALLTGDDKVALEHFGQLVEKFSDNLQYRLGYATSLAMTGNRPAAQEQYQLIQKRAGNDPRPWLLYGSLMSSSGNKTAASLAYQEALKRDRQNPFALNNLAFLMARNGEDLQKALSMAEEARRGLPRSTEIHDTIAYVYVRLGMKRNAAAALEQAMQYQSPGEREHTRQVIERITTGDLNQVRIEMEQAGRVLN